MWKKLLSVASTTTMLLVFAPAAHAEAGSITVVGPSANDTLAVAESVTVNSNDCPEAGQCSWYAEATAEPPNVGCSTPDPSSLIWVNGDSINPEEGPGTLATTFSVPMNDYAGTWDLCLFATDPNTGDMIPIAQTSYAFPSPTGTATVALEPDGTVTGAVTITQTLCGSSSCSWFASMTDEPGGGPCPSSPDSSAPVWVGPIEGGIGTWTWPYSFTPSVSGELLGLCIYIYQDDAETYQLIGSTPDLAIPAASSLPSSPSSGPPSLPRLTTPVAKFYTKIALRRRLGKIAQTTLHCRRTSRTRMHCAILAVTVSGVRWSGQGAIWLSRVPRGIEWNYSLSLAGKPRGCSSASCARHLTVH